MKQIKYIALTLFVVGTLQGCGIYSSYERPSQSEEMVDSLFGYIEATDDTSNISSIPWRKLFTSPELQTLIERGLESNTDLNVARLGVEQADAALKVARLAFLPSLDASAQASLTSFGGTTTTGSSVSLSSAWEIDVFGKLRNAKKAAAEAFEQSVAYRQAVQTQLVATIAGSYYSLLMLDEQLRISEQTQQNWAENLRTLEAMKRAGRINETAVLQSEASSIALSSSIVTIKESIAALENSLSLLLAIPTEHIERGALSEVDFPSSLAVGVPIELLSSRPDIRMAESALAEAFYLTAEARSSLYPSITLVGSAGYASGAGDILYNLVGSLTQPIFNRGTLKAQLRITQAQQEQALLEFNQAILDAGAEVNNALSEWQSAKQRLEYSDQQIEILEKTVTKTKLLMKHGSADYLDVLTAQLSLLQTELSWASDKYNQTQGVINLYRALGGGQ